MPQNKNVKSLIDNAAEVMGGRGLLAKHLSVPVQHISNWSDGSRVCVPADRARLAGIANKCAIEELIRSTLERSAGTVRGKQLLGFFKCVKSRCFRA